MDSSATAFQIAIANLERSIPDASFWVGFAAVLVFACGRFRHSEEPVVEDVPLMVRAYTTRFRFYLAAAGYSAVYLGAYAFLVAVGSMPFMESILAELFGQLPASAQLAGSEPLGTPTWAALVATSSSALGWVKWGDQRLRRALHRFASIPEKAARLADEFLALMEADPPSEASLQQAYGRLKALRQRLTSLKDVYRAQAYHAFFLKNQALQDRLDESYTLAWATGTPASRAPSTPEGQDRLKRIRRVVERHALFVCCSTLHVEASEYDARRRLQQAGIGVALPEWQFRPVQIVDAIVLVAAGTVVGGLLAAAAYTWPWQSLADVWAVFPYTGTFAAWTLYAVPLFVLPMIFGAGVQLYWLDRQYAAPQGAALAEAANAAGGPRRPVAPQALPGPLGMEHRLALWALTLAGAYALATLPLVAGAAIGVALAEQARPLQFGILLPWGVAPAVTALMFLLCSSRRPFANANRVQRAVMLGVDFLAHAVPAALIFYGSAQVAYAFGLGQAGIGMKQEMFQYVATVAGGLVAGLLGAAQCSFSRQFVPPRNGHRNGRSLPAPPRIASR